MKHVGAMVQQGEPMDEAMDACHVQCTNQLDWKPTAQNSHWHCLIPAIPKKVLE